MRHHINLDSVSVVIRADAETLARIDLAVRHDQKQDAVYAGGRRDLERYAIYGIPVRLAEFDVRKAKAKPT